MAATSSLHVIQGCCWSNVNLACCQSVKSHEMLKTVACMMCTPQCTFSHFVCVCAVCRDTAGQERFKTITTAYYRGAMVSCINGLTAHAIVSALGSEWMKWWSSQVCLPQHKSLKPHPALLSYTPGNQRCIHCVVGVFLLASPLVQV